MSWTSGSPALRARFCLDPDVSFLNHGSFGATPVAVLAAQARWRTEMEREPVDFLVRRLPKLIADVRARVAGFVGADPGGLVLVQNATTGVATVLQSIDWHPQDEIVLADSTYYAVKQAARALADRYGVRVVEVAVPFPIVAPEQATAAFVAALGPRTKLVIVDHVVSATALVMPVEAIVAAARARGIATLVDGAHAPGMLPLSIDGIGADFYTGNLHKWVCTPKGTAILWIAEPWRDRVHPLAISHGYRTGLFEEFDWTGTSDPSAWLAAPDAIDVLEGLGIEAVRASNHALVREGRELIAAALGVDLPHPDDPRMYGSMATIPVPWAGEASASRLGTLTAALFDQHHIEVPFTAYDRRIWVRISGQIYNAPEEYERLATVLRDWRA